MSEAVHHGYGIYWKTWGWLLVMTTLALVVGSVDAMPGGLKALLLVSITLAKVGVIGAFFMHLRSEKLDLVLITLTPIILAIIFYFFIWWDAGDSTSRILTLR